MHDGVGLPPILPPSPLRAFIWAGYARGRRLLAGPRVDLAMDDGWMVQMMALIDP